MKNIDNQKFMKSLGDGWEIVENHHLEKEYDFPDFQKALEFVNRIGELAEVECHHPDLYLSYGKLKVELWTRKVNGLSEKDFALATKCDELAKKEL